MKSIAEVLTSIAQKPEPFFQLADMTTAEL
jgi:hypothetical protein